MTPVERSLRARMAAYSLHAQRDPRETTSAARAAFLDRFEREVDPDGHAGAGGAGPAGGSGAEGVLHPSCPRVRPACNRRRGTAAGDDTGRDVRKR